MNYNNVYLPSQIQIRSAIHIQPLRLRFHSSVCTAHSDRRQHAPHAQSCGHSHHNHNVERKRKAGYQVNVKATAQQRKATALIYQQPNTVPNRCLWLRSVANLVIVLYQIRVMQYTVSRLLIEHYNQIGLPFFIEN